jgi:hypothetical protein
MRLDLGGVRIEFQAQALDEVVRELLPVEVGIGHLVRVVVAHRAVDLAGDPDVDDAVARGAQRQAKFAISLPSVVGEAGCPWVRESIARSACSCARSRSRQPSLFSIGSITSSRAPRTINA